jgi:A/G-specific adenine glycosylase
MKQEISAYSSKDTRFSELENRSSSRRRAAEALSRNTLHFQKIIWRFYKTQGRHALPWRKTKDVYKILVSEVMLQQTQVDRVTPFYTQFLKRFPTATKLASAPLSEVLKAWQGLGYNRRAKMLQAAARELAGRTIATARELQTLPGVGPYTARAVAAFAWNEDGILIETNIRTAIIKHFFPGKKQVSDADIEKILQAVVPKGRAREWYSALMDYGAHLKHSGIRLNARMSKAVKQKPFKGSAREARGAILKTLSQKPAREPSLVALLGFSRRAQMKAALGALIAEKLIQKRKGVYRLAD